LFVVTAGVKYQMVMSI